MRLLQRSFDVKTRYGGGFVQQINGVSGGRPPGARSTGSTTSTGSRPASARRSAASTRGDRVWWDHHDWGDAARVPAVVGSFPEPFLSGVGRQALPVRLDCARGEDAACDEVEQAARGWPA